MTKANGSRQLSAIRKLETRPFDILAAMLFDEDFRVYRAARVPFEIVRSIAVFIPHVNAHRFMLTDGVWSMPGVEDVTAALKLAEGAISIFEPPSPRI